MLLALLAGSWGGVLAAAACPHAGCRTDADAATAPHVENSGGHGRHENADGQGHHAASHEDHSVHAPTHDGEHAAEQHTRTQTPRDSERLRGVASGPHDPTCAHCVGRSDAPSRSTEWQPNPFKAGAKLDAPPAAEPVSAPHLVPARELRPTQHAPPGRHGKYLLLGVFRI